MSTLEVEQSAKILVVEEVTDNVVAIQAALTGLNCELVVASSGQQALRYLLEQEFALVFLDVHMPLMDGFEIAAKIRHRKNTLHLPIIFVTAQRGNNDDVKTAYQLGAVDFLIKPISADVLRAKATVFVELHRRTAEVARQSALLKKHGEVNRRKALTAQRRRLEAEAMRERLDEQQAHTEVLSRQNAALDRIQRDFKDSNLRLEEADRKKDEFISILAHELRNPLAAVVSGIALLEKETGIEGVASIRAIMQRQCSHLSRLVDDLLDVSRLSSGKMKLRKKQVLVSTLLEESQEFTRSTFEQQEHTLEIRCDVPGAFVHGDPVRLLQIIVNLLTNAARYTSPGGHICLAATRVEPEDGICIRVSDNGRGMSQELIERVFTLFVQGEVGDGLGIGLTMVRDLARMHGGSVTAHSDGLGLGSEFRVVLPEMASPEKMHEKLAPVPEARESLIIVLVDDHGDLRELTGALLESWGHVVHEAASGLEGVALVVEKRPNLAIIDIGLPDIQGYEVAAQIRSQLNDACPRLIAMSGYSQPADRLRSKEAGFDLHLSKPVNSPTLREALHLRHDAPEA